MKHLFTLSARFIGGFVFIFILVTANISPASARGANDAGIAGIVSPTLFFCEGTYSIIAKLKNNGTLVLKNAQVNWSIVGVSSSSQSFTGNLKTDSIIKIDFGTYLFTAGTVTLKIWSSNPNGVVDSFPNNDTITQTLNILPNATAAAGPSFRMCSGNQAQIGTTPDPGYLYSWISIPPGFSSSNSNPTIQPYSTTMYYLTVKNLSGCTATDSVLINVDQTPNAYPGGSQDICQGQKITMGLPAIAGHKYYWVSSPPGYSSSAAQPTFSFVSSETISLTEVDQSTGCSNSRDAVITVLPKASATPISGPQNVCPGSAIIYTPSFQGNGYTYFFHFGDSVGSTGSKLIQSFDTAYVHWGTPGKVTLWLISQNIAGCQDSVSLKVTITTPPIANFKSSEACAKLATSFTNSSGSAVSAKWYFGDSTTIGLAHDTAFGLKATHNYQSGGKYKVKMVIANIAGCLDSTSHFVTVDSLPLVRFSIPKLICVNSKVSFQNLSPDATDTFLWSFGDGGVDSLPAHTYAKSGTFSVSLQARNAQGCIDTLTQDVTVKPLPGAGFLASQWTYRNFNFKADDTLQTSYAWDFGDTTALGTGYGTSHSFAHNGLYLVKLSVISSAGCTANTDTALNVILNGINPSRDNMLNFELFPNPFSAQIQINYTSTEMSNNQLILTDLTGKHIADLVNQIQMAGKYSYTLDANAYGLKPGMYILNAIINGCSVRKQILKLE